MTIKMNKCVLGLLIIAPQLFVLISSSSSKDTGKEEKGSTVAGQGSGTGGSSQDGGWDYMCGCGSSPDGSSSYNWGVGEGPGGSTISYGSGSGQSSDGGEFGFGWGSSSSSSGGDGGSDSNSGGVAGAKSPATQRTSTGT
ncbi:hypothetical protein Ddye_006146 [Dipteronia dyeriana]|uniref:Uncharacterized protein n=1 Tax=Dipteronia dyeriana TaxID=168575 RepID=A0AAD9XHW2_9ROSI|nr:hypothetical protein Ddye_006146 [Dipteronia dyeriana]